MSEILIYEQLKEQMLYPELLCRSIPEMKNIVSLFHNDLKIKLCYYQ